MVRRLALLEPRKAAPMVSAFSNAFVRFSDLCVYRADFSSVGDSLGLDHDIDTILIFVLVLGYSVRLREVC